MKVERIIDPVARVVTLTVSGRLGDEDLLGLADQLAGAPQLDPDFSLLIDLRHANGQDVTSDGVYRLVEQSLVLSEASRRAVVVPTDLGFGMSRMYETLRKNRGGAPRPFRDYDEALRWVTSREKHTR
jgi:hypothetical protein